MNSQASIDLMPKVFLADAPRKEYIAEDDRKTVKLAAKKTHPFGKLLPQGKTPTSEKLFDKSPAFNVASWLSFDVPPKSPVSLLLVWKSGGVESSILVDECHVDKRGQAMLSGKVTLNVSKPIEKLAVYCGGVDSKTGLRVDDLYMQKVTKQRGGSKSRARSV